MKRNSTLFFLLYRQIARKRFYFRNDEITHYNIHMNVKLAIMEIWNGHSRKIGEGLEKCKRRTKISRVILWDEKERMKIE